MAVERAAWKASQPEIDIHRLVMTFEQLVPTDKWLETRNRHSDKEKFHSDLNRPESYEMSERLLKTLRKSGDFQAEYEGSISSISLQCFQYFGPSAEPQSDNTGCFIL